MNAIPQEFQHALVVADIDKMKIRNVDRHVLTEENCLLEDEIKKRFE